MLAVVILSILFTWLLCAAVCIGIGSLTLRWFRSAFSLLDSFWTGVAVIAAVLELYHFFRPVDLAVVFLLLSLALAGWFWNRALLLQQLQEGKNTPLAAVFLYIPAAVIIAFRAAGPCEHYDTGLYGAQVIRWITTYPVVPGLANLLGQLGFHSSVHLWMAVLDQGPWRGLAHHLFVGFLIAALFAAIVPAGVRVFRGRNISAVDWFLTLLFVPTAIWAATGKIVGANTDLPTSVACLVAAAMVLRGLSDETQESRTDEDPRMNLVIAMLLFSLAVTFKISSIVFASTGWFLACLKLWSLSRQTAQRKWLLASALILSAVTVLPWIGRGLILTGYPFFPSPALSIPVDWKVPASEAQVQADFARSFARIPQIPLADTQGFRWVKPWFRELVREREGFLIPVFFAMAGVFVAISRRVRRNGQALPQWLWLLAPSLVGLVFWFVEAPAMRFGEPIFWTAGATLGSFAAIHLLDRPGKIRMALLCLLLMTGWAAHPRLLWGSYFRPSVGVRTFLRLPEARVVPRQVFSGLIVNVPVETNQCWDAPIPCSPYFHDTLRLRRPANMKSGFASDGPSANPRPLP